MTPHRRFLARAGFFAAALSASLPGLAVTPNDYVMPYTTGSLTAAKGIVLVNSATGNFAQKAQFVAAATTVGNPRMIVGGTVDANGLHDTRPHTMIWAQANHWMRASLRNGLAPTPVQASNEAAANAACLSRVIYRNFATPTNAALFYQMPGVNKTCDDGDDQIKWITVTGATTATPKVLPGFHGMELNPVYNSNATLHAIYTLQGTTVFKISATDLTTLTTVRTGVSDFSVVGWLSDATTICLLNGKLWRIRPDGTLVTTPLRTAATGYRIDQAWLLGTDVFFVEAATSSSTPTQARIYRIPAAGGSAAALMVSSTVSAYIEGFTTTKLIYSAGAFGGDQALYAFPKTGTQGAATSTTLFQATAPNRIQVADTRAANVFFDVRGSEFVPPSTIKNTSVAYVRSDAGASIRNYGAGSAFLGGQIADGGVAASDGAQGYTRLLLGRSAVSTSMGMAGHQLSSLNPSTLATALLTDLPNNLAPIIAVGIGPGSIGSIFNTTTPAKTDVFAFDLLGLRYALLTNGTAASETPIF